MMIDLKVLSLVATALLLIVAIQEWTRLIRRIRREQKQRQKDIEQLCHAGYSREKAELLTTSSFMKELRDALDHEEERLPVLVELLQKIDQKHGLSETDFVRSARWMYYFFRGDMSRAVHRLEAMLASDDITPRYIRAAVKIADEYGVTVQEVLDFDLARVRQQNLIPLETEEDFLAQTDLMDPREVLRRKFRPQVRALETPDCLSPNEVEKAALDTLAADRMEHLRSCHLCQAEVAAMTASETETH